MKEVGFGVVGCGVISGHHCKAINKAEGAKLVAVCDVIPERARKIGEEYGVPYYDNLAAFLAHPELEVANICVPSGDHANIGVEVAKAGKHVLTEKPIDITLEAADRLIEACRAAGVKLGVISQHRFAPDVQRVKQLIESGEFGTMVLGEASIKWYRTQKYYDSGAWRGTKALDGGGAFMNQGVHYVDLLQWLMGGVVAVKANVITRTHDIEVEDTGVAVLRFENGAIGTITASTSIFPGLAEKLEIHGRDATALIEADKLVALHLRSEQGEAANYGANVKTSEQKTADSGAADPSAVDTYGHTMQIADFAAAVRENRDPAITGEAARRPLEIILAIYRASAENHEITLAKSGV